ncbi:hypothetical protein M0802_016469 [Mischocyttarus mexicanus]|nr:hypothetical protein M0802_016469 [Mischocyttarus mexicanus]
MDDIREFIRETINIERKKQRARVHNESRPALGECIENASYSSAFVTEMAKKLKKKTLNVNDYHRLQNALIQSESNIEALLKITNIIFSLARDISGNNPISQLGATNCCCNIACGNTKACTAIAKYISPYLITECDSLNCPLLEVCLWTIGNLSSGSNKAFEILHAQKCLRYLIKLLNECDNKILPSIVYAILHYLYGGYSFLEESELIELAEACKNRRLFEGNSDTLWLLALLSSTVACGSSLYYVISSIFYFLHQSFSNYSRDTNSLIVACIRILGNLLTANTPEDVVNTFLTDLQIDDFNATELFRILFSHRDRNIRKKTLWLFGNLCNHGSSSVNLKIQDIFRSVPQLEEIIAITSG